VLLVLLVVLRIRFSFILSVWFIVVLMLMLFLCLFQALYDRWVYWDDTLWMNGTMTIQSETLNCLAIVGCAVKEGIHKAALLFHCFIVLRAYTMPLIHPSTQRNRRIGSPIKAANIAKMRGFLLTSYLHEDTLTEDSIIQHVQFYNPPQQQHHHHEQIHLIIP
jgi:hypothetical protein